MGKHLWFCRPHNHQFSSVIEIALVVLIDGCFPIKNEDIIIIIVLCQSEKCSLRKIATKMATSIDEIIAALELIVS